MVVSCFVDAGYLNDWNVLQEKLCMMPQESLFLDDLLCNHPHEEWIHILENCRSPFLCLRVVNSQDNIDFISQFVNALEKNIFTRRCSIFLRDRNKHARESIEFEMSPELRGVFANNRKWQKQYDVNDFDSQSNVLLEAIDTAVCMPRALICIIFDFTFVVLKGENTKYF